jgi:hypothetical protein
LGHPVYNGFVQTMLSKHEAGLSTVLTEPKSKCMNVGGGGGYNFKLFTNVNKKSINIILIFQLRQKFTGGHVGNPDNVKL